MARREQRSEAHFKWMAARDISCDFGQHQTFDPGWKWTSRWTCRDVSVLGLCKRQGTVTIIGVTLSSYTAFASVVFCRPSTLVYTWTVPERKSTYEVHARCLELRYGTAVPETAPDPRRGVRTCDYLSRFGDSETKRQ
jgi:hypothetical protein